MSCLCGQPATQTAYLPSNVWSGLKQLVEPHAVCDYHAEQAKAKGYEVVPGIQT